MNLNNVKSVLFLGVGGVSMHQLALAYKKLGLVVYGYDAKQSSYTNECKSKGIVVVHKFCKAMCNVDLCVKTAAIKNNSRIVKELIRRGVKIVDRAEALGEISKNFKCVIGVAGTHGKSTTASLIYEILRASCKKVSCHIGADVFAPRFELGDDFLVVEACEYNKSFLSLYPYVSVVTNVEAEHMDCYKSLFNLKLAFSTFLRRGAKKFVFDEESTRFLKNKTNVEFVTLNNDSRLMPKLKGEHNLKNISLALAVVKSFNIDEDLAFRVVNQFGGVPRRFEYLGNNEDTKIFIDYAHHPTEVKAFVETFANDYGDYSIVFQPHTYSRTKNFLNEFISVLSKVDNLVIFKEYPAREKHSQGLSAYELFEKVKEINKNVQYSASFGSLERKLKKTKAIAFVGAGDINLVAQKFVHTY